MKKEVSPAVAVAAAIVILIIVGIVGYKMFFGNPAAGGATPEQVKQMSAIKKTVMSLHRDVNGHYVDSQGRPVDITSGAH